jgi:hypothetical protein
MRINHLAVVVLIAISSATGVAQGPDMDRVNDLATAISHAEGFGIRGTIPNRYHNPGDLRIRPESPPLVGQVRIGKAGHIVFKDDEAGKAALRNCILQMVDGRSRYFRSDMTLNQVARVYAENWRPWVKIVSRELGVAPETTLRAYFHTGAVPSPARFRPLPASDPTPMPPAVYMAAKLRPLPAVEPTVPPPTVSFATPHGVLDAVLDTPVDVPPLVEDAPQHHKFQKLLHPVRYYMDKQ